MSRKWESWWTEQLPENFPRSVAGALKDPVRRLIFEKTVEVGTNVLDVGCATCIDYEFFRPTEVSYTGIDITRKFIEHAKQLYPEVVACQGSALDLSFEDESFDVVYEKSVIEHVHPKEWRKLIRELWRVTKKRMMLAFFIPPHDGPAKYDLLKGEESSETSVWNNTLNHQEVINTIRALERVESFKRQEVGTGCLYTVDKRDMVFYY